MSRRHSATYTISRSKGSGERDHSYAVLSLPAKEGYHLGVSRCGISYASEPWEATGGEGQNPLR
ncbi:unnamed protein product [Tuber melanosporum]|uniref:(Perigord truffle) hypothetical protein n=1 Tax=Tuber melanosporum (strain Mel28) TaxID=656061 RepID=D5GIP5_TUBMM|nr:uncharacterized protein GSTUM_00008597001 [Tuber melanosporum]CAZ84388.1 unnamed protein product [Tuber melanosporum]